MKVAAGTRGSEEAFVRADPEVIFAIHQETGYPTGAEFRLAIMRLHDSLDRIDLKQPMRMHTDPNRSVGCDCHRQIFRGRNAGARPAFPGAVHESMQTACGSGPQGPTGII